MDTMCETLYHLAGLGYAPASFVPTLKSLMHQSRKALFLVLAAACMPAHAQSIFDPRTAPPASATQQAPGSTGRIGSDAATDMPPGPSTITNRSRNPGAGEAERGIERPGARTPGTQDQNQPQVRMPESRERLEFQDFILQSTGRDLQLFGANLFRAPPTSFAPIDNVPVTSDYVIGPGDEIVIRAWGQIDVDYNALVDRNGSINVPRVGTINVAGIKYQDLTAVLKTAFGRVFRNFELTATLGQLRSIQIFVVGQAKRPGTYTLSSLSSLVTALFSVGGPSAKGSMRAIQLKRGSATVTTVDLYDLLVSGDKSKDVPLLPGDVIYIPPVGELVAISGSVNNPAIFELKGPSSLADLVRWSGGLATTAQGQKVTVERIDQRRVRRVDDFTLDQNGLARGIRDGDLVTVFALTPRFENAVTLRGNVAQPGRFQWRAGMRVTDLIPNREALISREYWLARSNLVGMEPGVSRILQSQDEAGTRLGVTDLIERPMREDEDITVGEAIRRRQIERDAGRILNSSDPQQGSARSARDRRAMEPGVDRTRLLNQITPSLKEVNWDYAVVERLSQTDLTTALIPFNLGRAVLDNDPQQNLLLQPGDVVTIFSREDLQVSFSKQTKFIRLEGELATPGVYQIQPGETLRQLVVRIGGLAPSAYLFGAEFTRESTRVQQQKNLTEALNRLEQDIQRASSTRAQNIVNAEDAATIKQQADSQQQLVARLRLARPTGRIVMEVPEDGTLKDLPNLPLEDGDRFFVPSTPSMVNVFGSVYSENSFIYKPEKRLGDYLAQAGGPTRFADRNSIYVLRADGSVVSKRQSGFLSSSIDSQKLMPGDSVVVPEELDRTTTMRMLKDVGQIFYQFGLGAAALRVLRN